MNIISESGGFFAAWNQIRRPVVVFGAGSRGKIWSTLVLGMHIPIFAICDNHRTECPGSFFCDIPVLLPEKLDRDEEYYVLITTESGEARKSMIDQLAGLGIRCTIFLGESFQRIRFEGKKDRFVSYSENFEDLVLSHALKNVRNIFYVDVGARDPHEGSVTNHFYLHGGNGINIDANEKYISILNEFRERDVNINIGVGDKKEDLDFSVNYESFEKAYFHKFCRLYGKKDALIKKVPCDTLANIMRNAMPLNGCDGGGGIHICKIDVEGFERRVLEGIDWACFRPWIFCIECAVVADATAENEWTNGQWEGILRENGYSFALYDVNNCYYVANERIDIAQNLLPSWYLLQMYDCFQVKRIAIESNAAVEDYFYY